jgi:hypothetical protein
MVVFALEPAAIGPKDQRDENNNRSADYGTDFKHGSSPNHAF